MINKYHNIKINYTKALRERNYSVFEGRPIEDAKKEYRKNRIPRYEFKPENGESFDDVVKRIKPLITSILKKYNGKTVSIIFHGDLIRTAAYILIGKPIKNLTRMEK